MNRFWLLAIVSATAQPLLDYRDLQRAKSKVPRAGWRSSSFDGMSVVLNRHLEKMFPLTKPCAEWSVEELQDLQAKLHEFKHDDLDDIYRETSDKRRMRFATFHDLRDHWFSLKKHVDANEDLWEMHRDGHCHEAVMWLVHHVAASEQHTTFASVPVPQLPTLRHRCDSSEPGPRSELCKAYEIQISCADAHSGSGIIDQSNDTAGVIPENPKYPGRARQRRCDSNYEPACGPCEGIGGPYWGDQLWKFQPTKCELVATPDQVPESDRPSPQFPEQFVVHQLGSDRLVRVQNGGNGTGLYSQIKSTLWYDFPVGGESSGTAPNGTARLRHDTFYDNLPYRWLDHGLVSEIHMQNRAQREANITGPMISLIPSLLGTVSKHVPGGCTCVADPVGVPVLGGRVDVKGVPHSAFLDGKYLGRVNIDVEYDGFKLGDKGHGDMTRKKTMLVDHWTKWFLHLFVDANKTSPTYGQPVRFYGPYSGFAVYVSVNKTKPPEEVWDTACVNNGWGTVNKKSCMGKKLSAYKCMNVEKKHPEVCAPYAHKSEDALTSVMFV